LFNRFPILDVLGTVEGTKIVLKLIFMYKDSTLTTMNTMQQVWKVVVQFKQAYTYFPNSFVATKNTNAPD
jgi:cell shape-determining protein MreC